MGTFVCVRSESFYCIDYFRFIVYACTPLYDVSLLTSRLPFLNKLELSRVEPS